VRLFGPPRIMIFFRWPAEYPPIRQRPQVFPSPPGGVSRVPYFPPVTLERAQPEARHADAGHSQHAWRTTGCGSSPVARRSARWSFRVDRRRAFDAELHRIVIFLSTGGGAIAPELLCPQREAGPTLPLEELAPPLMQVGRAGPLCGSPSRASVREPLACEPPAWNVARTHRDVTE
jgi:hypothetical protein